MSDHKNKILTSDSLIEGCYWLEGTEGNYVVHKDDTASLMIEFAKLHVKAALEAFTKHTTLKIEHFFGNKKSPYETEVDFEYNGYEGSYNNPIKVTINRESILTAYSEENIK